MLLLNAGNTVHHKSNDLLLIFHQLLELVCQNCVQLLRLERRQIASSFSALTVHPALPVFRVSLHSFEALPMKGGSMLSAAVWLLCNSLFFSLRLAGNPGSFPRPLSAAEEKAYLERFAAGDLEARNVLIEHNLRLVAHIVKKMCSKMQISLVKK